MKTLHPILLAALVVIVLGSCVQEEVTPSDQSDYSSLEFRGSTIVQQAAIFPFLPAGPLGGSGNVLTSGDIFSPTREGSATLKRGSDYIQFNIHTTGLPEGAYTVWYVIFNEPGDCQVSNPAGGVCGGGEMADLFLSTTAILWATGKVVKANGAGNFRDRLYVGEHREPGTQEALVGSDLDSPLENPQGAEVHLIIKYHGPASDDPDVLHDQTHTLLGSCGVNEGANSFDAGVFGIQCFDPQAAVFPAP